MFAVQTLKIKEMKNIICPISPNRVQEHIPRIIALMIVLSLLSFIATGFLPFAIIALADFAARAFRVDKYSIFSRFAKLASIAFNIESDEIDKAPKIFASRLGFIFTLSIVVIALLGEQQLASIISGLLIALALLESTLSICVGCYIYTWFVLPFYKNAEI